MDFDKCCSVGLRMARMKRPRQPRLYVNEELKKAIQKEKITGIGFEKTSASYIF
jgi:hypothetical protein